MKRSGRENSMPFQVVSRAMETVINQHGLDIETLMQPRVPMTGGIRAGDSATSQFADGSSQRSAVANDSKSEHEMDKNDAYLSSRPPMGPSGTVHDIYQGGSVSHMNTKSFDHESPSSFDTRSANSQSQDRRSSPNWEKVNEKDSKRSSSKRKRPDPSLVTESHLSNMQPPANSLSRCSNLKIPEDTEVSSAHNSLNLQQGGGSLPLRNQNNAGFPFEKSQPSRFSFPTAAGNPSQEIWMHHNSPSSLGSDNKSLEAYSAMQLAAAAGKSMEHGVGIRSPLGNVNKADQGGFPNTVTEMTTLRNAAPSRDTGKSSISHGQGTAVSSMPFKEQHLKQLRAQCLVYLAFRNGLMPKKLHLDVALGNFFPVEGTEIASGSRNGKGIAR